MASCGVLSSSSTSDEQLAQGVRDGDDRAFELLYRRYRDPLCRYAGRLLRDPPAGEDAAQVALTNAYRALRAGQTPRAVRPWLYRIARNAAWGLHREHGNAVELPATLEARGDPPAADTAALTAALARLPERQRAVFALRELRGASNRETAELLGLRESQVEQLLFAGRARLAELLLFGDSVSCATVRAAASLHLGRHERRALKRHAHHCAECRTLLGSRLKLGARLAGPLEALRRLAELFIGAGAPAKASVAAAVALAASGPLVLPAVRDSDEPVARQPIPRQPIPRQHGAAVVPAKHTAPTRSTPVRAEARRSVVTPVARAPRPQATPAPAVPTVVAPASPPASTQRVATISAPVPITSAPQRVERPAAAIARPKREPAARTPTRPPVARLPQRPTVRPAERPVERPVPERPTPERPVPERPIAERVAPPVPRPLPASPRELTAERSEEPIVVAMAPPSPTPTEPAPRTDSDPVLAPERGAR